LRRRQLNTLTHYLPLLPIFCVIVGFALRQPAMRVVFIGLLMALTVSGKPLMENMAALGNAFANNRLLVIFVLSFPLLGALERFGLRDSIRLTAIRSPRMTLRAVLLPYLFIRQLLSALGLTAVLGQAQSVRPILAPLAEGAGESELQNFTPAQRVRVKAFAAATDNVGVFFGEDIFLAFGGVLLMQQVLSDLGIKLSPAQIAWYGVPTALAAFLIHGFRCHRLRRSLIHREAKR
jgi:uncharacterized membrane protein